MKQKISIFLLSHSAKVLQAKVFERRGHFTSTWIYPMM
jgi:hypothetical protein